MWVVLVAVLVVSSGVFATTPRVLGSPTVDGYGTQWFFWFAGEVLAGRQAAGWTDLLFFPWGKDVYAHTGGNLLDAWLAWPLRLVLGDTWGYDAWIAVVLATNALAGVRLAGALGVSATPGGRGLRWIAALALVLNPYVLGEIDLGRPTQAWLAPAGLCLAGLVEMRRAREGAVAGAWLAVTALAYWYYGLLLGALAVLVGAWRVVFPAPAEPASTESGERARVLVANLVAAGVTLALVAPFALPMLQALDGGAVPGLLALDGTGPTAPLALRTVEGDPQGLYVVAPLRAEAGSLLDEGVVGAGADGALIFNPGLPALSPVHLVIAALGVGILAMGGALRGGVPPRPRMTHLWIPVGLLGALFVASGPAFVVGDAILPNRAWIALVEQSDVLRRWWWPGRAVFLAHLLIAPLAALVLGAVPARIRLLGGGARRIAGGVVLVAIVAPLLRERLLPLATWDATVPPGLACLAEAPAGAVIDVPLLVDQKNLWFQTVHRHPILGGMLLKKPAFAPKQLAALRAEDPVVRALDVIGDRQYTRDVAPATDAERAALIGLGYRYVLARIDAFTRQRVAAVGTERVSEWSRPRRQMLSLLGEPAVEDGAVAIWTLDRSALGCDR